MKNIGNDPRSLFNGNHFSSYWRASEASYYEKLALRTSKRQSACTSSNFTFARPLHEKVGFIRPTKRYRKNSISCGALLSGTTQWTSGVGWSFDFLGQVARGIKGKGPRLTFEPLRLLSEFRRKQKMSELNKYTIRTL